MERKFLYNEQLPFCKGCGHSLISENTDLALQKLNKDILDVILVTDIGCHGIIDKSFKMHTVHGLHGRSVAVAAGIAQGITDENKKIIVFLGDGGATIGMQHIVDAAHNNYNMTVVVHNNMLYGMTGGQPSEFTPLGFKTPTLSEGASHGNIDICAIATAAGANYVRRIMGIGDFSDLLAEAFSKKGFSLVEVIELCPSYAMKANPGMKLKEVAKQANIETKLYVDNNKPAFKPVVNYETQSLIEKDKKFEVQYKPNLEKTKSILFAGSAGEGVQAAAEFLSKAALINGLYSTKKGSYPVTVGIGFSASEVIISPEPIIYTGIEHPDIVIISSEDGLNYVSKLIPKLPENSTIYADSSLSIPETSAKIIKTDIRSKVNTRDVSIYSIYVMLKHENLFPLEAFTSLIKGSKIGEKIDFSKF